MTGALVFCACAVVTVLLAVAIVVLATWLGGGDAPRGPLGL